MFTFLPTFTGMEESSPVAGFLAPREPSFSMGHLHVRLLDAAGEAIAATDPDGIIIYWNRAAAEMYGWDADEVVGHHVSRVTRGEFVERAAEIVETVSRGETWSEEIVAYRRDGSPLLIRLTDSPVFDDEGNLVAIIGVSTDLTHRWRAEEELADFRRRTDLILASIGEGIHVLDTDGRVLYQNPASATMVGWESEEIVGRNSHGLLHYSRADGRPYPIEECPIFRTLRDGVPRRVDDDVFFRRDGSSFPVEYLVNPLFHWGELSGVVVKYRDITEELQSEARLEYERRRLVEVFRQAPNFMAILRGPDFVFEYANEAYYRFVGDRPLIGLPVARAFPEIDDTFVSALQRVQATGEPYVGHDTPVRLYRGGNELDVRYVDFVFHPLVERDGTSSGVAVQGSDVTDRWIAAEELRASRDALEHQSLHDWLTGLPNRTFFLQRVREAIDASRDGDSPFAVFMIDLDDFKDVNDSLGHEYGDELLQAVAERLMASIEDNASVARLGGDEFGILTPVGTGPDAAEDLARRLLAELRLGFSIGGYSVDCRASLGIAAFPGDGVTPLDLLRRADLAMYEAKRTGTAIARFDPAQEARITRHLAILSQLRHCIERNELVLHYQPKIDLATGRTAGVEALLRWQHPTDGLLLPGEFMEQIENSDLIEPVTEWVLTEAVRQLREWRDRGLGLTVAINLSARCLLIGTGVPALLASILRRSDVPADQIVIEITESALLDDSAHAILGQLNDVGVRIAIDDFGTGYSSLAYLQQLRVDELKVDQSFVKHMASVGDDAVIVRSTIDLAHSLGLTVVAEGVEDAEALAILRATGCDYAQGHYFTPSLTADRVLTWLQHSPYGYAPHTRSFPLADAGG